ncbi:MAG: FIST C-terminal domain-containing protein [Alphaproteobacteria bacterium]
MANEFRAAHAGGATWQDAARDIIIGLGELDASHRLGFLYVTDAYADSFDEICIFLRQATGVPHWIGTIGFGVVGAGKEYFDEPALSAMVAPLSEDAFRIFNLNGDGDGAEALRRDHGPWLDQADSPLIIVHADPRNDGLLEDIDDLAEATNGYLVGGLTASRGHYGLLADGTDQGPVSGAMVSLHSVPVQLGLTQGCTPIGRPRIITDAEENVLFSIDDRPALEVLKEDIGEILSRDLRRIGGYIFAALLVPGSDTADYTVRNLVGIDENEGVIAIGSNVEEGERIMFCRRDRDSAVEDLKRMLNDLKRRAGGKDIRGGLYFSCVARGPNQFGPDSAELGLIREMLGDFPVTGFFANGEISNNRLYGYTGVLALFL